MHTGAFHYRDKSLNEIEHVTFCTASECLRHDPSSIRGHFQPMIKEIKTVVLKVITYHFQSNGPSLFLNYLSCSYCICNRFYATNACNHFALHPNKWSPKIKNVNSDSNKTKAKTNESNKNKNSESNLSGVEIEKIKNQKEKKAQVNNEKRRVNNLKKSNQNKNKVSRKDNQSKSSN